MISKWIFKKLKRELQTIHCFRLIEYNVTLTISKIICFNKIKLTSSLYEIKYVN